MKAAAGLSLCFFAAGVQAFVGHAPLLQPRSLWQASSSSPPATKAALPEGRRAGRAVVTRMGWGDDVVFSKVRGSMPTFLGTQPVQGQEEALKTDEEMARQEMCDHES